MEIVNFRFIDKNESFIDKNFINWSRPYEWGYVLSALKDNINSEYSVHNTSCGNEELHIQFANSLNNLSSNVFNSDIVDINLNKEKFKNYFNYNILSKNKNKYDVVLCISTLEHLPGIDDAKIAFNNLLEQVNDDGRLIITYDYPCIKNEIFEEILNKKIEIPSNILNGDNSIYPSGLKLSIVLIDIKK